MRVIFCIFTLVITGISCQNSIDETENEEKGNENALTFGDPSFTFPELSAPLREQPINWGRLEDILMVSRQLNGSDFQALKNYAEQLTEYSDQFSREIPPSINTNQIRSRLLVLKTRAQLLKQISHRGTIDSSDLQQSVIEMNDAVATLILHLNEQFQKNRIDLQRKENERKELMDQKSFRDSIFELERQDQNREM